MKISYKILDQEKMAELNKVEMDTLLYLFKNQNEKGEVQGVHYQDVVKDTGIVKQSFYNAINGLKDKKLISFTHHDDGFYNVTIKNNDFSSGKEAMKQGYINLQRKVFHRDSFKKLKAHEKYLVLLLLKRTHEDRSSFRILTKNFYDKFSILFGVTKRVVRSYLHNIKKFFSVGIIKGKYYITYKHSVFKEKIDNPERFYRDRGYVRYLVRKLKIRKYSSYDEEQTTNLMHQYRHMAAEKDKTIEKVMLDSLWHINKEKALKERKLDFKYLNTVINRYLKKEIQISDYHVDKAKEKAPKDPQAFERWMFARRNVSTN